MLFKNHESKSCKVFSENLFKKMRTESFHVAQRLKSLKAAVQVFILSNDLSATYERPSNIYKIYTQPHTHTHIIKISTSFTLRDKTMKKKLTKK